MSGARRIALTQRMFEYVPFEIVSGGETWGAALGTGAFASVAGGRRSTARPASGHATAPLLFTLSTCAFCEQARRFLQESGLRYSFIRVDLLPLEVKRRLRTDFVRELERRLYFPTLVIDRERVLTGFDRARWTEALRDG